MWCSWGGFCRRWSCLGSSGCSEVTTEPGSGHSAQSSVTSQDLWDAGIGRFDPAKDRSPLPLTLAVPQMWHPPTPPPKR